MQRRHFLQNTTKGVIAISILPNFAAATLPGKRKFKMCLRPGAIGVKVNQKECLEAAIKYGFEAIEPRAGDLAAMKAQELAGFLESMKKANISWGMSGLPVQFRNSEQQFQEDLAKLPAAAEILNKVGVKGMGTWIMPTHKELTYIENFKQHATRLQAIANILGHYDMKLGLEYVGPKTLMARDKFSFVRTMKECRELIKATGEKNVGVQLDSFHWFCAGETAADLLMLDREDIVTVDLNDAYAGRSADEQIDGQRELPTATGVIDLKAFLGALLQIGYDGPIRAEPFNKKLRDMDNEAALKETAEKMKRAFALVG